MKQMLLSTNKVAILRNCDENLYDCMAVEITDYY